ncbi:hypothetical protein WG66_015130 [Moniliophthora roreri]|nr:hypothetical protein WG66_015130 [Moniliophthora roreri]
MAQVSSPCHDTPRFRAEGCWSRAEGLESGQRVKAKCFRSLAGTVGSERSGHDQTKPNRA